MEILLKLEHNRPKLKVALFDFDGTISTLRHGWESIIEPFMIEMITGNSQLDNEILKEIREYVDESVGIQTIYQMQWLADTVKRYGRNPGTTVDPWWYKAEYNRRLMLNVEARKAILLREKIPENYLIKGVVKFLKELRERGIDIYVASGTDHHDVIEEATVLGLTDYFKEIAGAHVGKTDCSKEAILRKLVDEKKFKGAEVVVVGDGKVEIGLGREVGTVTLGVASDEDKLFGINPAKRQRLIKSGAHAIIGDFDNTDEILEWMDI